MMVLMVVVVPDKHVDDVDDIRAVVEHNPPQGKGIVQFPEAGSTNDEDEVVHHSKVDDDQPFIVIRFPIIEGQVPPYSSIEIGWGFVISKGVVSFVLQ